MKFKIGDEVIATEIFPAHANRNSSGLNPYICAIPEGSIGIFVTDKLVKFDTMGFPVAGDWECIRLLTKLEKIL